MKIEFTTIGEPQPKGSKKAYTYLDKQGEPRANIVDDNKDTLKTWNKDFTFQANRFKPKKPLSGPVKVRLVFYLTRPKTVTREKRPLPITKKADVDKLTRTILDIFSGRFYEDDSQVVDLGAYKRYADDRDPGVDVRLEEISV